MVFSFSPSALERGWTWLVLLFYTSALRDEVLRSGITLRCPCLGFPDLVRSGSPRLSSALIKSLA
jgi:hypothetical protein